MIFYQSNWLMAFVCASLFFAMAVQEARGRGDTSSAVGLLWFGLSMAASAATINWFDGGWIAVLVAQLAQFIGIAIFRVLRDPN